MIGFFFFYCEFMARKILEVDVYNSSLSRVFDAHPLCGSRPIGS